LHLERRPEFDCILAHAPFARRMRSGSFVFGSREPFRSFQSSCVAAISLSTGLNWFDFLLGYILDFSGVGDRLLKHLARTKLINE
jgi:hypothetical protein